jgi:hypothetical protein
MKSLGPTENLVSTENFHCKPTGFENQIFHGPKIFRGIKFFHGTRGFRDWKKKKIKKNKKNLLCKQGGTISGMGEIHNPKNFYPFNSFFILIYIYSIQEIILKNTFIVDFIY